MSALEEKSVLFRSWLIDNGAVFSKVDWPSLDTESGIRGAIAVETIETNENILQIPKHLMISPPLIFANSDIGEILSTNSNALPGDVVLSLYLMYEFSKNTESFFHPYLQILPEPGNSSEWSEEQLIWLQDDRMIIRTKNRRTLIQNLYNKCVLPLCENYKDKFPVEIFTFTLFKFCWNSVQARAFGRRLPWTALVPFADCLNHNNLQTKYDYDVGGNNMFRLFPTGSNRYPASSEVFNSYGRRANDNLLMDYGFAMLDNEWDE
eukprot:gene17361-23978_t